MLLLWVMAVFGVLPSVMPQWSIQIIFQIQVLIYFSMKTVCININSPAFSKTRTYNENRNLHTVNEYLKIEKFILPLAWATLRENYVTKQDTSKVVLVITVNCYICTIILTRSIDKKPVQICELSKVTKSNLS